MFDLKKSNGFVRGEAEQRKFLGLFFHYGLDL